MFDESQLFIKEIVSSCKYKDIDLSSLQLPEILNKHKEWEEGKTKGVRLTAIGCVATNLILSEKQEISKAIFINCSFYDSHFMGRINDSCFVNCLFINSAFSDNSLSITESSFIRCDFKACSFNNVNLLNNKFNNCVFSEIAIYNCILDGICGKGCDFSESEILKTDLFRSKFDSCEFSKIDFDRCSLFEIVVEDSKIDCGTSIYSSSVLNLTMDNCNLSQVSIDSTTTNNMKMFFCIMERVSVHRGCISKTDIYFSSLEKHNITSKIQDCTFLYCDVSTNQGFSGSSIVDCVFIINNDSMQEEILSKSAVEKNTVIFL